MRAFIFVTEDDPNEWQVHNQSDTAAKIKALPCFDPQVTSFSKVLYPARSSEPWTLGPCLPGGGTGAPVQGMIYEIEGNGSQVMTAEPDDLVENEDELEIDDE